MKILRSYAVTFLDLSTESSVNEGNTTVQHFNLKILFKFSYSATATIINSLMLIQLHITTQHFNVVILCVPMPCKSNYEYNRCTGSNTTKLQRDKYSIVKSSYVAMACNRNCNKSSVSCVRCTAYKGLNNVEAQESTYFG
jgi:hypothetical protein